MSNGRVFRGLRIGLAVGDVASPSAAGGPSSCLRSCPKLQSNTLVSTPEKVPPDENGDEKRDDCCRGVQCQFENPDDDINRAQFDEACCKRKDNDGNPEHDVTLLVCVLSCAHDHTSIGQVMSFSDRVKNKLETFT